MIKLELTSQMVGTIGAALGARPYAEVAAVIAELQRQIDAQQQPKGPEVKPES